MLYWDRKTTCSKTQHIAGGRGGQLVYVRMRIDYKQFLGGSLEEISILAQGQLMSQREMKYVS